MKEKLKTVKTQLGKAKTWGKNLKRIVREFRERLSHAFWVLKTRPALGNLKAFKENPDGAATLAERAAAAEWTDHQWRVCCAVVDDLGDCESFGPCDVSDAHSMWEKCSDIYEWEDKLDWDEDTYELGRRVEDGDMVAFEDERGVARKLAAGVLETVAEEIKKAVDGCLENGLEKEVRSTIECFEFGDY